jgi:O-glycosyl hydrolase
MAAYPPNTPMKSGTVYLSLLLFLICPALHAASVTLDGTVTYQVIDGFGVNANHRSWNNNELQPVLDALIDEAGMTLFRVVFDNTDWEAINDNADPNVMDWTYYSTVYESSAFMRLWEMFAYLNSRGITNDAFFNFMGPGPSWMGGGTLAVGMEDEWAEMIASLLAYARIYMGLQFQLVAPNNEPDIYNEGIHINNANQYATALHKLSQKLDANGLGDVKFVGPDLAGGDTTYFDKMMADSVVMAKLRNFGIHSYGVSGASDMYHFIQGSAYPDLTFWMTEFNVWCPTCDSGMRGTYDWAYSKGTANYLLNHLANNASGGIVWEGYDSFYAHGPATWSYWGLFGVDDESAAVKSYSPRKNFYTIAQISKWVRPGAQRIEVGGSSSPFSPLLAFKHTGLGQVTIVGINTSASAAPLSGTLASLPAVSGLDLYYTSPTANLAHAGTVPVTGGTFSVTIPADCVFALTGSTGVSVAITAPVDGAQFNAPATIPIIATASTTDGSIPTVELYNGAARLGGGSTPTYEFTWNNVPMGSYSLTAFATDSLGNSTVSAVVNVSVAGPIAQIRVTPTSATVARGGTQQFTATARDMLGNALNPQPTFSWSVSSGGTIDGSGLFTAGSSVGGPFSVVAKSGGITGTASASVATGGGGMRIGNSGEGTSSDNIWSQGAWINAARFRAETDATVTTIFAKVAAISGRYKCAIYADASSKPGGFLRETSEVSNPSNGWQAFPLTSPLGLTSGSYYWLAIWSDDANARVYYSDSNGVLRWGAYNYGIWPDSIITTGGNSFNYCIYATGITTAPNLSSISVTPANQARTGQQQFTASGTYRAGSGKKDRRLSENSALLDALMMRPSRRAGYETTQTEPHRSLQGQGGVSGLARR